MSTANEDPQWKDCKDVYPPSRDIALALQDKGKPKTVKRKNGSVVLTTFPMIEKLANKIYDNIMKKFNPAGLTKNKTRGRAPLYQELVQKRRHVDVHETNIFFHEFANDGKVFLITNNPVHSGIDVAIAEYQEQIRVEHLKKVSVRTNNDGLRLACILLDPQHRGSVSGIMSKKNNVRAKSDVAGDPVLHFYEEILPECFSNKEYQVSLPPMYDSFPDDKDDWDPNDDAIFEVERQAVWLKDTWDGYVRTKYKKSLDRWNKDTGGGDGNPLKFVDFCGTDRWLLWVFMMDRDANFLLAHTAAGRMPRHMQVEAGFPSEDISSMDDTSPGKSAALVMENELSEAKKQRVKLGNTLEELTDFLKEKRGDREDDDLDRVHKYSSRLTDESMLNSMSPETKEVYMQCLRKKRRTIVNSFKVAEEKEDD